MASRSADAAAAPRAAVPFMLYSPPVAPVVKAAIAAAAVVEGASHDTHRNTRCRVSYFLCEAANQLNQQGAFGFTGPLPLSRYDVSDHLDISLCKVKRVLALLSLSGVLTTDDGAIRVLDWQRLCAVAQVDPARLSLTVGQEEEDELVIATGIIAEEQVSPVTAGGEPACFV